MTAFEEWKIDLEKRLAARLKSLPEVPAPVIPKALPAVKTENFKASIWESALFPGTFYIAVGTERYFATFVGHGAHQRAMARLQQILKENQ